MPTFRDVIANWKNSVSYSESGRKMYTQSELDKAVKRAMIEGYKRGLFDGEYDEDYIPGLVSEYMEEIENG